MCASKLKLPESLTANRGSGASPLSEQEHLTRRAELAADTKLASAKMELMGQALGVIKQGLQVLQSYNELQSTYAEWQGRVQVAEAAYRAALAELDTAQAKQATEMQRLKLMEEAQKRVLALFDDLLAASRHPAIEEDKRRHLTATMLQLSSDLTASFR